MINGRLAPAVVSLFTVLGACAAVDSTPSVSSVVAAWPGPSGVVAVDERDAFGGNLSGLAASLEGERLVLWAVRNGPSRLYRIVATDGTWRADPSDAWGDGRRLRYPDGSGAPDAEGVTLTAGGAAAGVYVASERDNDVGQVSRNSVLRFEVGEVGEVGDRGDGRGALRATHEWQLNGLLPAVLPNSGVEAITWMPDADLVAVGFTDAARGTPYDPAHYPDHGDGLFVVGLEANGALYVLALNHRTEQASLIATVHTGMASVMGLSYDTAAREVWASCDESCGGSLRVLAVDTVRSSVGAGTLVITRALTPPAGRPESNHEGFALAPAATCANGMRDVFWVDDAARGKHALRRARLACSR